MKLAEVGWQPDPTGRYDYRYWDGTDWCDDVFDDGLMFRDPMSIGVLPPPTQRSRRWAPRMALLGAGALLAGVTATAAVVLVPRDGNDTETAGRAQPNPTTTEATTSSTSTTAAAGAGAGSAAGGPSTSGPAAPGGVLPPPTSTPPPPGSTPPPGGEAPADPGTEEVLGTLTQAFKQAGGGMLTDAQAECIAQAMIDSLGIDRIRELGLDTGDMATMGSAMAQMTQEEAAALSQKQMSCAVA